MKHTQTQSIWNSPIKTIATLITVMAAVLLISRDAGAAIARPGAESVAWKKGATGYTCEDRVSNLFLAGSFVMPSTGEAMHLWVGKPRTGENPKNDVWGFIGKNNTDGCEAQCKVTRFERFKKDQRPALMELDCEGSRLKMMRMPMHVQWVREKKGFDTVVRLGSSLFGMAEAPLTLQVNRYEIMKVAKK